MGTLLYGVVVTLFNGLAELSMVVSRLPVFYKQKGLSLLPFIDNIRKWWLWGFWTELHGKS